MSARYLQANDRDNDHRYYQPCDKAQGLTPATDDIEAVMTALAAGDIRAYEPFYEMACGPVRRILAAEFRSKNLQVDRDRLDDLVGDGLLELIRLAPGWRADGGAKPWNWAYRRLIRVAYAGLGLLTSTLDDFDHPASPPDAGASTSGEEVMEAFELITLLDARGRTLARALEEVVSPRDKAVWLDVLHEQGGGNTSPAVTVARLHGLTEQNVRKICQRVRQRLARLAASQERFASLVDLPALDAA